jgi:DGQHR domain-containing protein
MTNKPTPKKSRKKKKKILSAAEKLILRRQNKLHKDLLAIFRPMGFEFLSVANFHKTYRGIKSELDAAFVFENLIIICEETISSDKDHLRKKYDYFEALLNERDSVLNDFKIRFSDKFGKFDRYSNNEYKLFYIYVSEPRLDEDLKRTYSNFKYLDSKTLKYFNRVIGCLKFTARNEFYKYLGIDLSDIGSASTGTDEKTIDTAVIIPERSSGFPDGVQLFSFLMKAEDLMDCAYVFRKDSWDLGANYFYQRLIDSAKVESIRKYLSEYQRTFIDNIIVSLPDEVSFFHRNSSGNWELIQDVSKEVNIENIKMKIPYKINSIGIIDGQHRVYGHYKGNDSLEIAIASLRQKRHLLVTGLYYDKRKFSENEKRKFESELFLQINSKQKKAEPSLLQYIQNLQAPNSPVGLAISVLNRLNGTEPFLNMFHLSPLDGDGIKTPTIITYALKDLLEINDKKETLYKYWKSELKNDLNEASFGQEAINEYIKFSSDSLILYFKAIKANFPAFWTISKKAGSKLLSVTSIVAFILSFKRSLEQYCGIQDFDFYKEKISHLNVDFSKGNFPFVSSQWPKFVEIIEKEVWQDTEQQQDSLEQ